MSSTLESKIQKIKDFFAKAKTTEEKYELIIQLGHKLQGYKPEWKTDENKIEGCQSLTYVKSFFKDGKIFFFACSDALISSGLAFILIQVYSEEKPEVILQNKPIFLKEIGIESSISPNRANGLYEMFLRMQRDALQFLTQKKTNDTASE